MNSAGNTTTAVINTFIEEAWQGQTLTWIIVGSVALVFYDFFLRFPQEVEHIWLKSFSLPTLFYIFARYGVLVDRGLRFSLNFVTDGRSCNTLAIALDPIDILSSTGVQGLLAARAYTMCQGSKIFTTALVFGVLASFISKLYALIAFPGCLVNNTAELILVRLVADICVIYTDIIISGIIMWKVFGIWKLKRETGIQSGHSLVSVLLSQSISRFCFVILLTVTDSVISASIPIANSPVIFLFEQGFISYQIALSSILVADFTLDLRQLNSAKIEASSISLPSLQFSNVLQHVHQSIVVELANPEEQIADDLEGDDREDIPRTTDDMEI